MIVYADVVFLINFAMDFFVLVFVSLLAKRKFNAIRIFLGSFVMALIYCLLMVYWNFSIFWNVFFAFIMVILGVLIAFSPISFLMLIRLSLLSFICAFAVGGIGLCLFYFSNGSEIVSNVVNVTINHFPVKILIASTCAFYIIIRLFVRYIEKTVITKRIFYPVKIFYGERIVDLNALLDTGNSLHDPLSKAPVIVAEFNIIKELLPDNIKNIFTEKKDNDLMLLVKTAAESNIAGRVRVIPFESIGKQNGVLFGFRPDKVEIKNVNNVVTINNAIIGIYNFKLSQDGSYHGLLGAEIL